jgi:NADH-quinone oxidoreductase subunit F
VAGLYACPTDVNNVESIASVPWILKYGAADFAQIGTERSKGFGIFSLSATSPCPGSTRPRLAPRCATCWTW